MRLLPGWQSNLPIQLLQGYSDLQVGEVGNSLEINIKEFQGNSSCCCKAAHVTCLHSSEFFGRVCDHFITHCMVCCSDYSKSSLVYRFYLAFFGTTAPWAVLPLFSPGVISGAKAMSK